MEEKLPKGWENPRFTDILDIMGGTQPPKSHFVFEKKDGYVRLLQIRDFGKKPFPTFIPDKKSLRKCKSDDILIARYGASIGRILTGKDGAYNVAIAKVDIPDSIEKVYVYYYLKSFIFQSVITSFQRTAQSGFNKKDLSFLNFLLPPLPEQKRIVAKLDTLFASLDNTKARLEKIPQLLKNFRQAVLTQAVTGKLTEEWREGKELGEFPIRDNKFPLEFDLLELKNLPMFWLYVPLGNISTCARGKFTARPRNDPQYYIGEFPFLQIGDLPKNGGIAKNYSKTLNSKGKKVSKEFPKRTVVIAIVGATIGNTGVLDKNMFFPDSLIGINSISNNTNKYIEYFLRAIKLKIRELSYAGGGQPNIKLPNITNLAIPTPPLEEQHEIVRRVESLFAKADAIELQYQKLKEKVDALPQAILAKAFRGELVEQNPLDEPASVLLDRIRAEKEKIVSKGKKKTMKRKVDVAAEPTVKYGKKGNK